jgi:hypothetical protein
LWASIYLSGFTAEVDWPQLNFTKVAPGSFGLTSIADPQDGSGRLFVTLQSGKVMMIQNSLATVFLDIQDRVQYSPGGDLGMFSVAFPPGFATNHHFYVYYNGGPEGESAASSTVSRFSLSTTNSNVADPSSEQRLLVVPFPEQSSYTLSGGLLLFGPDGLLYVGMGDSGFSGFGNYAQNTRSFQGKILRLDVESATTPYKIPADNPFVGNSNYLPEIWALGVRNPWRFSFDRATGDFYCGDVGQIESEEIDFKAAATTAGQNYGWPIREGLHLYAGPESSGLALTDPVLELLHVGPPASVTGGFVSRAPASGRMAGIYFYADAFSGKIWGLKRDGTNWVNQLLAKVPYFITAFGEDQLGQLYVGDYISGNVYAITDNGAAAAPMFDPPGTNSFTENIMLSSLSTNATIRYTVNGLDPGPGDPAVSAGGLVTISSGTTLKGRAFRTDLLPSPVTSVTYNLKAARPTFNPQLASITNGQPISILSSTPGAAIRYTLNGNDPTATSDLYSSPIPYTNDLVLKARAFKAAFADSEVAIFVSSPVRLESFVRAGYGSSFTYQSRAGWNYQVQVAEDPTRWRDFGPPQPRTNAVVSFEQSDVPPIPIRKFFRLKAFSDLGE